MSGWVDECVGVDLGVGVGVGVGLGVGVVGALKVILYIGKVKIF